MYGPKGIGCFFFDLPIAIPIIPPIVPRKVERKRETRTSLVPKTKPITAKSFISPPPIPPFDTIAITRRSVKPTAAPSKELHHGCKGRKNRSIIKTIEKNSSTLSGIIIYFKSETVIMINKEISVQDTNSSELQPSRSGLTTKRRPVKSSNIG